MEKERPRNKYETNYDRRSQEPNGNSPSFLGKRKKNRENRQGAYLQEWLEKSSLFQQNEGSCYNESEPLDNFVNHRSSTHWQSHAPVTGQRLFTAVSDPTVGRYSVPVGYSLEPLSLPLYAVYQSAMPIATGRSNLKPPIRLPNRGRPTRRMHRAYPPPVYSDGWQNTRTGPCQSALLEPQPTVDGQEYTSLPHVTQSDITNPSQRRFSDPGLGPLPNSNESSDQSSTSSSSPGTVVGLVLSLVEQVNSLHDSNRLLFKQLHDTKVELESLKLQAASWRQLSPDYEPGMLSGLVREVRDASRVREEALLSRVRGLLGNTDSTKWEELTRQKQVSSATSPEKTLQDLEELKVQEKQVYQLQKALAEKSRSDDRLLRIEDQLKSLQLQISGCVKCHSSSSVVSIHGTDERPPIQGNDLGSERNDPVPSLQDVYEKPPTKDETFAQTMVFLQKKMNGMNLGSKQHGPGSLENTSESSVSIGSSKGRSSLHSAQVTMSGPVTDL